MVFPWLTGLSLQEGVRMFRKARWARGQPPWRSWGLGEGDLEWGWPFG